MAIQSNSSDEQVLANVKYYCGIGNFKVVAVNPTKDELAKLGINLREEPKYIGVDIGDKVMNKIVFYVKSSETEAHSILTRVEVLVSPDQRQSEAGNLQWTNPFGVTTWAASEQALKDNEKMEWFFRDTKDKAFQVRPAFEGEEILLNFLRAWANVKSDGEVYFDKPEKIAKGDVTELRQYAKALKDNEVRLLLGVKANDDNTKFYQVVYMRHFERTFRDKAMYFTKKLKEDYGAFNAIYDPTDFTLKEVSDDLLMGEVETAPAGSNTAAAAEDLF